MKAFRDLQYIGLYAMLPLSAQLKHFWVWKVSKLTRPEIHQFIITVQ